MPKVEFFSIFLLLASFRMAHFLLTPAQQYNLTMTLIHGFFAVSTRLVKMSKELTIFSFKNCAHIMTVILSTMMGFIHWLSCDGIFGLFCVVCYIFEWFRSFFRIVSDVRPDWLNFSNRGSSRLHSCVNVWNCVPCCAFVQLSFASIITIGW